MVMDLCQLEWNVTKIVKCKTKEQKKNQFIKRNNSSGIKLPMNERITKL